MEVILLRGDFAEVGNVGVVVVCLQHLLGHTVSESRARDRAIVSQSSESD